jgi:cytochrome o ubiquinol oxidase subunit 1
MQHYDNLSWQPWLIAAAFGTAIILVGVVCQIVQLVVSIRHREELRDVTGDPWNGRTLEWATASPPPAWNFAFQPKVAGLDAFWSSKSRAQATRDEPVPARNYEPVEMPKNSATGFVTAFFAVVIGFALIWHIWWLAGAGVFGAFMTLLAFSFRRHNEIEVPAEEIARFVRSHQAGVAA